MLHGGAPIVSGSAAGISLGFACMSDYVRIRPASVSDFAIIAGFNLAMALESEGKSLDKNTVHAGTRALLEDENLGRYFVAELNAQPVGQAMITYEWSDWRNGTFWWIQSVYVQPAVRRNGVFRQLYDHIRKEAALHPDVCGLRLYVHRDNGPALEVYRRVGMSACDYVLYETDWSTR